MEPEKGMTEAENQEELLKPASESELLFIKGKTERILRKHGKATPKNKEGGKTSYSDIYRGILTEVYEKENQIQEEFQA